jgi:hypothetical protein
MITITTDEESGRERKVKGKEKGTYHPKDLFQTPVSVKIEY